MDPQSLPEPSSFDLSAWLLSLIPPEALAWIAAHPVLTIVGLYVLSALLSSVPTTYVFELPKIGLKIPVGYLVHFCIGNVFQVLRKVSPAFAGVVDKLLPGKREVPPEPAPAALPSTAPAASPAPEAKKE